jgi:hypothetical protein
LGDVVVVRALLPLLSRATFDFLVCVGLAWGLPGRLQFSSEIAQEPARLTPSGRSPCNSMAAF